MANRVAMIGIVALLAAVFTASFGSDDEKDGEPVNPQVMRTFPAEGQVLPAGPVTVRVSYDILMRADSYSFVRTDKGAFPTCTGKPRLLADGRTFEYACVLEPGQRYHMWFNYGRYMNFVSADHAVPAISYGIGFSTKR